MNVVFAMQMLDHIVCQNIVTKWAIFIVVIAFNNMFIQRFITGSIQHIVQHLLQNTNDPTPPRHVAIVGSSRKEISALFIHSR